MKQPALHVLNALCNTTWAIQEEWLERMLSIAMRENMDVDAVAAQLGRPLENTHTVDIRDGVAVLHLIGPTFRRADMFTRISGATDIGTLARDFTTAIQDTSIQSVVIDTDSPGGEVNGTNEFSQMIYAARGQKPITAYVSHLAASAAYWIASACDEIVCDPTAIVGNIGVVATYRDKSKNSIEFVSSNARKKRPNPSTESGQSIIQAEIDALEEVFIATVARNRGKTAEQVVKDFDYGNVFVGQHAVTVGLADRLGSFESVIGDHQVANRARMLDQSPLNSYSTRLRASLSLHSKESTDEIIGTVSERLHSRQRRGLAARRRER
jgi:signal peptide peptidase SppA